MGTEFITPFSAESEETQFMEHYGEASRPMQQIIIAIVFLAVLAGIVVLRDMLKTADKSRQQG